MKKILFISYQFPPQGGPGVQRSTRFVQHLREFNYDPIVLTIIEEDIKKAGCIIDYSLLNLVPKDVQIVRISSSIPFKMTAFLQKTKLFRIFWFFLYPLFWERSANWPNKAYDKAETLIKQNDINLVYTSSGPFSSLKLGYKLKKKLNINWVADLRDPYTDAYAWSYPSKLHWFWSRLKEKQWISYCDSLIVNTREVKKLYIKRKLKAEKDIFVITNGY